MYRCNAILFTNVSCQTKVKTSVARHEKYIFIMILLVRTKIWKCPASHLIKNTNTVMSLNSYEKQFTLRSKSSCVYMNTTFYTQPLNCIWLTHFHYVDRTCSLWMPYVNNMLFIQVCTHSRLSCSQARSCFFSAPHAAFTHPHLSRSG